MMKLYVFLLMLSMGSFMLVDTRPRYVECQDSAECGSFACCVIGTKMYSLPQCMPYLSRGESCSDQNFMSNNKTVIYPDNAKVMYTNVHLLQCPCEPGLSCGSTRGGDGGGGNRRGGGGGALGVSESHVCFDPLLMDNLNSISNSVYDSY